ncbi:MAG: SufB/SufD family protein [Pseudobdellovibrio sp.]
MLDQNSYNQHKLKHPLESLKAADLREQSFTKFMSEGLPSKKDEAWKFTSLSEVKNISWSLPEGEVFLTHDEMVYVSKQLSSDFYNLVFVNGVINNTLSDSDIQYELKELEEGDYKVSEKHTEHKLAHLSRGFNSTKLVIHVDKSNQLDKPLQIVHVISGAVSTLVQPVIHINIAPQCELKLINHYLGLNSVKKASHLFNAELTVNVGDSAHLKIVNLENSHLSDFYFGRVTLIAHKYSQIVSLNVAVGSKLSRHYLENRFEGEGASSGVYGLSLLAQEQHCDNYTFINHKLGHNQSVQHYKSILADKSHSVFRGRVRIEQDAQKANSEQLNNNLLLSKNTQADSVPQLEIYADDVKAGHGSTVGRLNQEEIFYFLSRGISEKQAVQMLSHGYAKELVYKLENESIENFVFQILDQKLNEIF